MAEALKVLTRILIGPWCGRQNNAPTPKYYLNNALLFFKIFFYVNHFLKVFIKFFTMLLLFYVLGFGFLCFFFF